jgi:hypothetical protein
MGFQHVRTSEGCATFTQNGLEHPLKWEQWCMNKKEHQDNVEHLLQLN